VAVEPHVYLPSAHDDRLRQGEVLSDLIEWNIAFNDQGEPEAEHVDHPFAVIVTQDCDLEQDHRARTHPEMKPQQRENGLLGHVLVVVAADFEASKEKFPGSDDRKRAHQNKDQRYQFLAPGRPTEDLLGLGFPSLMLDFKRAFSVPVEQLLRAVQQGETKRRGVLVAPYVEHLGVRFGYFLQRVALQTDHHDVNIEISLSD
jgi:hypothetical protein